MSNPIKYEDRKYSSAVVTPQPDEALGSIMQTYFNLYQVLIQRSIWRPACQTLNRTPLHPSKCWNLSKFGIHTSWFACLPYRFLQLGEKWKSLSMHWPGVWWSSEDSVSQCKSLTCHMTQWVANYNFIPFSFFFLFLTVIVITLLIFSSI